MGFLDTVVVPGQTTATPVSSGTGFLNTVIKPDNQVAATKIADLTKSAADAEAAARDASSLSGLFTNALQSIWQPVKSYVSGSVDQAVNFETGLLTHPLKTISNVNNLIPQAVYDSAATSFSGGSEAVQKILTDYQNGTGSTAGDVANFARLTSAVAGVLFSPISGAFSAAQEIPVLKQVADAINIPFTVSGIAGAYATGKIVDHLPISESSKAVLKQPLEELGSLMAQIVIGGKVMSKVADVYSAGRDVTPAEARRIVAEVKKENAPVFHPDNQIRNPGFADQVSIPTTQPLDFAQAKPKVKKVQDSSRVIDGVSYKSAEEFIKAQDTVQLLRGTKGMTADQIMATHTNIKLTKDVPAKDVYGNKLEIPKGEVLTPYEMKDGKIVLQDGQTYVVSKNQYQNIKGNAVTGEAKPFAPELAQTQETVKGTEKMAIRDKAYADFDAGKITREQRNAIIDKLGVPNETKYSQYQLPDGKNYKEVLIQTPTKNKPLSPAETKELSSLIMKDRTPQETARMNELGARADATQANPTFKSSHWNEPNVISHLRLNERTYKGKKVTFMEELQSDWAREVRKQDGVVNPFSSNGPRGQNAPLNPLLKNWQELSVKRALQEAVANDSEYFAWINGEQTSARYNLATQVKEVKWNPPFEGEKTVSITPQSGSEFQFHVTKDGVIKIRAGDFGRGTTNWEGKKLDEVLGKGLADKIMGQEKGTLSGEGLQFGGEWAKNLYDKQVKNIVEDVTGAKVETIDLGLPVEKNTTKFILQGGKDAGGTLTEGALKPGLEINIDSPGGAYDYVVTDVLGNGKFEAVFKNQYKDAKHWGKLPEEDKKLLKEKFDISTKKAVQQAIKITDEVRAKVLGEAQNLQASGVKGLDTAQLTDIWNKAKPEAPVGSGDTRTSGLAASVERDAIAAGLADSLGKLPEYRRMDMKEQATMASELIKSDPELAKKVALGEEPSPNPGLLPESVYTALRITARETGDIALLRELAQNSALVSQATAAGQRIKALDSGVTNDPVHIMQDIKASREANIEGKSKGRIQKEKKQIADEIKLEIKKNASKRPTWEDFITEIKCKY